MHIIYSFIALYKFMHIQLYIHMYIAHKYLPLETCILDIAGDSIAACIFSQDAMGSISSHFSNIWSQHHLVLVGHPVSMAFSSPVGTPNNVPITFHSAPYFGVMRSYRYFSDGISVTVENL